MVMVRLLAITPRFHAQKRDATKLHCVTRSRVFRRETEHAAGCRSGDMPITKPARLVSRKVCFAALARLS